MIPDSFAQDGISLMNDGLAAPAANAQVDARLPEAPNSQPRMLEGNHWEMLRGLLAQLPLPATQVANAPAREPIQPTHPQPATISPGETKYPLPSLVPTQPVQDGKVKAQAPHASQPSSRGSGSRIYALGSASGKPSGIRYGAPEVSLNSQGQVDYVTYTFNAPSKRLPRRRGRS